MRPQILINFAGIFCCLLTVTTPVPGQQISDYRLFTGYGTRQGDPHELIIIRRFLRGFDTCYLTVSPQTLQTSVVNSGQVKVSLLPWNELKSRFAASAYVFALDRAELSRTKLQDAGIRKVLPLRKGIDLTIDLCPSRLPLDREIFTDLIKEMAVIEKPVPIAISVTGVWIREHPGDFRWLDSLTVAGELSILWINHSFNHHTSKKAPLTSNFLLAPGTDINSEVLDLELLLLEKNITPSVFFRFPGLVSDKEIYEKIIAFGLIPVGSDAWLAKGERPVNGSIVLIHANGNEPLGVRDFIRLIREEQSKAKSGQWELLDLRQSLAEEEE